MTTFHACIFHKAQVPYKYLCCTKSYISGNPQNDSGPLSPKPTIVCILAATFKHNERFNMVGEFVTHCPLLCIEERPYCGYYIQIVIRTTNW